MTNFAIDVDNFSTTVATARSAGGGSLVVGSVTGFPTLTGTQFARLTIADATTGAILVHLKATGNSGTTITVAGTLDGYSDPSSIPIGAIVRIGLSSGTLGDIQGAVNVLENAAPGSAIYTSMWGF